MICKNNQNSPISLKISYLQQLELKILIPPKFQHKYCRHWMIFEGFNDYQQYQISKKYFSFLNEGDLIKIKASSFKLSWKQRSDRKNQIFKNLHNQSFIKTSNLQNTNDISRQGVFDLQKFIKKLKKVFEQDRANQMSGIKNISIFLNVSDKDQFYVKLIQFIQDYKENNIYVNIFIHKPLLQFNKHFKSIEKWVDFRNLQNLQDQLKNIFYKLSKLTVKKISINLRCFDGQLFRKELNENKKQQSEWSLLNNNLSIQINYPYSNRIYIHFLQIRNLGYQKQYQFELQMKCLDINDKIFVQKKRFNLRPIRQEFESIISPNYMAQNENIMREWIEQDKSLNVQSMKYFDKLQGIKQVCETIQVQIKNNSKVVRTDNKQQNQLKMMHSFEI